MRDHGRTPLAVPLVLTSVAVFCMAALHLPADATVIDFDNLTTRPSGTGGQARVTTQYQGLGVTFNNAYALSYPNLGSFTKSGAQGIEQCYAQEFCTTPIAMTFTQPVSFVRVWVGFSSPLREALTVRLTATDASGKAVGTQTTTLGPANAATPVRNALVVRRTVNEITAASVTADGGALMNGIVVDDVEFVAAAAPPPVQTMPDLLIDYVKAEARDRDVRIEAMVVNVGTGPAGDISVVAESNAWSTVRQRIAAMKSGERTLVTFQIPGVPYGDHSFTVRADPTGTIRELDETNNSGQGSVSVAAPAPPRTSPDTVPTDVVLPETPPPSRDSVQVPDVVGRSLAEARRALRRARLTVGSVLRHRLGTSVDVVESQDPVAGTVVPLRSAVTLVQKAVIAVPDLGGNTLERATSRLGQSSLTIGDVRTSWALGRWNQTVRAQSPSPGTVVSLYSKVDVDVDDPLPTRALVVIVGFGGVAEAVRRFRKRGPPPPSKHEWCPRPGSTEIDVTWGRPPALPAIELRLVPDPGSQELRRGETGDPP